MIKIVDFIRKDCFCPSYSVGDLHRWLVAARFNGKSKIYFKDYVITRRHSLRRLKLRKD